MKDLKNNVWNKRLPSFMGFLFLGLAIITIGWLSSNAVLFGTKAAADKTPKNVKISNITDTSFTVSFITDNEIEGTVNYGETNPPNQIALDDRDKQAGTVTNHKIHHITINKLKAETKYFFIITSGDKTFFDNDNPYEITTITGTSNTSTDLLLKGKVALDDGTTPTEAVVYATLNPSQVLSTLANANGEYNFDLSSIKDITPDTVLNLFITDSTRESKASLLVSQANPVPLIILSKNYDFLFGNEPLDDTTASESASITPAAFPITEDTVSSKPQILSPEEDQGFKDQQPLFKGTAIPGEKVEIIIESEDPITTSVKASANGNWIYRPDTKLAPGNHTITIKTVDASGVIKTISQSFVVFAAGSEFSEPSVSPTSPTIAPTATAAPTVIPTATPTIEPTVKTAPTSIATATPTTPQVPIPVTGNTLLITTIIGIVSAISIGALLFFLTAL